ncbi:hypothetical protein KS4_25100 [Poriferisphaera corsica]|uniref:Uncharacterized protein n=1 Tax=Poriferisphaera corsica TaxID=2528020 RepID=A0A517YW44_9BACT|nr:hypothetical protein [Poriferisphaera corsica]QDU34440.1 hypothetical protein KS4_25100 [Poriferisphaera corsica]
MSDQDQLDIHASDDDLLAGAIPIPAEALGGDDLTPIDVEDTPAEEAAPVISGNVVGSNKIRTFQSDQVHKENWSRQTNADGTGATHCKTFFAKLRQDAIHHLDEQINVWLDEHPDYEVKFSTSCVGKLVGKTNEDAVFMTVWV